MQVNSKVYPDGEFVVWLERKTVKVEPPPEAPDYLGLSLLCNSHKRELGLIGEPEERPQRGLKGITRHGARTVRNASYLLQERYGKGRLCFLTCTLPATSATEQYEVAREWAEITRIFCQSLRRLLLAAGLSGTFTGCTEIQGKRFKESGGMPLHLHLVFCCKGPTGGWKISADQFRAIWARAVQARCETLKGRDFRASVDCQRVKKDASGYLGKYMSKGPGDIKAILAEDELMAEFIPAAWWFCSHKLRKAIKARTVGGLKTARQLLKDARNHDSRIKYASLIEVEMQDGHKCPVALIGMLSPEGRYKYGWRENRSPELLRQQEG